MSEITYLLYWYKKLMLRKFMQGLSKRLLNMNFRFWCHKYFNRHGLSYWQYFYHFLNVNLELLYSSCENVWNRLVSLKIINEELLEWYVFLHIKIFDYNRTVHKLCIKYAFGIHIYHKMLLVNVFYVLYL